MFKHFSEGNKHSFLIFDFDPQNVLEVHTILRKLKEQRLLALNKGHPAHLLACICFRLFSTRSQIDVHECSNSKQVQMHQQKADF